MLRSKTTFILGAGLSHELGMPLGSDLKAQIANVLEIALGRQPGVALAQAIARVHEGRLACRRLLEALPLALSIDNLIEHRSADQSFVQVAKIGIAVAILAAERRTHMRVDQRDQRVQCLKKAENSAIFSLFQILTANSSAADLDQALSNVSFINFNYDRCLENFLFHAIIAYSGLKESEAANLVNSIPIWHPYGTIGRLPWQPNPNDQKIIEFGQNAEEYFPDFLDLSNGLRTFSEEIENQDQIQSIRSAISESQQIIFLGFAFHSQNMRLLKPVNQEHWPERVGGTCYKIAPDDPKGLIKPDTESFSRIDTDSFKDDLRSWIDPNFRSFAEEFISLEPLTCRQFVSKYETRWRVR